MRWIHLIIVALAMYPTLSEEDVETNDVSALPAKVNLDANLRRALLKALTELENEEINKVPNSLSDDSKEKIIERASASSVSIFSNGETVTVAPFSINTLASTMPDRVTVVFQKSNQQPVVPTFENESDESESILTSASSSFANQPFGKEVQSEKFEKTINQNSIFNDNKVTKLEKLILTTSAPTVLTEESEGKVEDVQFFSAPLVAAFTVHQDEAGLPKKVEPIFKSNIPTNSQQDIIIGKDVAKQYEAKLVLQQQEKIRLEEIKKHQEKLELNQKQKALEEEIYRLNLSLKQQQQIFLKQQEDLRNRNNAQQFILNTNPTFSTERNILNHVQQLPFNTQQQIFKPQSISIQSSLSFNPLTEAGKLPNNAQFLPIKDYEDFKTPFSINQVNRQVNPSNFIQNQKFNSQNSNFNQHNSQLININTQNQSNKIFRQNNGINNINKNTNSFSIQPSNIGNFENPIQNNRFFRSNLESSLTSLQAPFLHPLQANPVQNNRFFRSNLEGSFLSPNKNGFNSPFDNNYQLSNLLFTTGAFRGKSSEDLSLISKVLSLNHLGEDGLSLRPELRQQFVNKF